MPHTSPFSRAARPGGESFSDEAGHAPLDPPADLAEYFAQLGELFARWDELSPAQKDEVVRVFVIDFLPHLPAELLQEMESFLERRSGHPEDVE